jgi:cytidine deaminase
MIQRKIETELTVYQYSELSVEKQALIEAAKNQIPKAYVPYSGFHVGAAILLANGEVIAASNQENAAYPSGLCAERVAMFYANAQYPNVAVNCIAIAAFTNGEFLKLPVTPCGACRQVLLETEVRFDTEMEILLFGSEEIYSLKSVKTLLPLCFEKSNLNK